MGVNPNQLSRWTREIEDGAGDLGNTVSLQVKLKHLGKGNEQLKLERDKIKKAAVDLRSRINVQIWAFQITSAKEISCVSIQPESLNEISETFHQSRQQ